MALLKKKIWFLILILLVLFFFFILYFSCRRPAGTVSGSEVEWGVAYSKIFAQDLGLDWQEFYLALLEDLKVERIRLPIYWSEVEPHSNEFNFKDYDWLIQEAEKRKTQLILVIGIKLPRWPECHQPSWVEGETLETQKQEVLEYIKKVVERYKSSDAVSAWQVENEPFFKFGHCPLFGADFLEKEIDLVQRLDPQRPIIITDSGEFGRWFSAAKRADIFGTTVYRIVWSKYVGYFKYPLPPKFFWFRANLIHFFFPNKKIIISELQAEPWSPVPIVRAELDEQFKSMSFEQFLKNIKYAEAIGFPEVYLWGAEWWYWLKTKKDFPEFWDHAVNLFNN